MSKRGKNTSKDFWLQYCITLLAAMMLSGIHSPIDFPGVLFMMATSFCVTFLIRGEWIKHDD